VYVRANRRGAKVNIIDIGRIKADLSHPIHTIAEESGGIYTFIKPDMSIRR